MFFYIRNYIVVFINVFYDINFQMREILDSIKDDWKKVIDAEEKKILHDYAYIGQIVAIGYSGLIYNIV